MTTPQLRLSAPTAPSRAAGRRARPVEAGLAGVGGLVVLMTGSWLLLNPATPAVAQGANGSSGVVAASHAVPATAADVRTGEVAPALARSAPTPTPSPLPLDATSRNPFLSPLAPPPQTATPALPPGTSGSDNGATPGDATGTDGSASPGTGASTGVDGSAVPGTGAVSGTDGSAVPGTGSSTGASTGTGSAGTGTGTASPGTGSGTGDETGTGGTKCLAGNCDEK